MGHYRCMLAISWVIFTLAGAMVSVSMFLPYWLQLDQATEHFAGPRSFQNNSTDYLVPTWCMLAISSFLSWTCSVLLLVLACTDWCCHVTSSMRVVPKITMVLGALSGALAITGCVLVLLDTYVTRLLTSASDVYPGYCFYLTLSAAIFLLMAGCLVLHVKRRNKIAPEKPAPSSRGEAVDQAYTVMPAYIPEQYFANPHNPKYTSQPVHASTTSHYEVTKRDNSKSSHATTQTLYDPQHSGKLAVTMATQTLKNPTKKQPSLTTSTQTKAAKIKAASAQTTFNVNDDPIIVRSPPVLTSEKTWTELNKSASVESPYY
ncbi:uncharacterized protein LOC131947032 [Physella acuta]|uniref:uncharacterized protein LOC131947032 n=1 Tax=Physella acuta TaxID=109671 RepID=UPI0027DC9DA9|nr:uncharacterized protein LOC131947032 [Physella acuta]